MKPWSEMTRAEQLQAWDDMDRIIATTARQLMEDIDEMLATRGVPLRLSLRHRFIPTDISKDPRL